MTTPHRTWRDEAKCATLSPAQADEIFFIGPGKSSKRAKLFCQTCPVKQTCNNFAVMYNECGIWAGGTDEERRNLDPFISEVLRAQAEAEGHLESRNLNDFIPQVRHQHLEAMSQSEALLEQARAAVAQSHALLDHSEALVREAVQLEALVHPFDVPIAPQQNAL